MPQQSLADCVALLRSSKDEQRFVGLLLATKLVRSPDDLRKVFDAGLPFVRRLLLTPGGGDEADADGSSPYRALALSVLASFASDAELSARIEFVACASAVAPLLLNCAEAGNGASRMTTDELRDCTAVLGALLRPPNGLTAPTHGRLLSTAVAPAAARPAIAKSSSGPCAAAAACALLDQLAEEYSADAASTDAASTDATAADASAAQASRALGTAAALLDAARQLCPSVASLKDSLALSRLRSLRALVEGAAAQRDAARALPSSSSKGGSSTAAAGGPSGGRPIGGGAGGPSAAAGAARSMPAEGDAKGDVEGDAGERAAAAAAAQSEEAVVAAAAAVAPALRDALSVPLAAKLTPDARADALRTASAATHLCGAAWLVAPPDDDGPCSRCFSSCAASSCKCAFTTSRHPR